MSIPPEAKAATDLYFLLFDIIAQKAHGNTIAGAQTAIVLLADTLCVSIGAEHEQFCVSVLNMREKSGSEDGWLLETEKRAETRKRLRSTEGKKDVEAANDLFRLMAKTISQNKTGITPAITYTALIILTETVCDITGQPIETFCDHMMAQRDIREGGNREESVRAMSEAKLAIEE